ncbi:MAG: cytochrome c family protein [Actinobacteria bacterium]|nr:cytochrome c family protein [Actinomycetota bacterium]
MPPDSAAETGDRPPVAEEAAPNPPERRSAYRHPLAAVGGSMVIAGSLVFLALFAVDLTSGAQNPYRALVTFIGLPALITLGALLFLLALRLQVVKARKQGVKVRFNLRVEPSDPSYMRNLWLFLGLLVLLLVVVAFSGLQAYKATESVAFCGDTCHTVMEPQAVTYEVSPHARVACAECHIGPGASFWVKSKVDGLRQVWKTITNSFDRPIATPIRSLRPAQETCEECHWPEQFYGQKLITHSYYRTDEANSPWTISLLMNIGGGDARTGGTEGIHWQMIVGNRVEYVATDPARQEIAWVRRTDTEGNVTVYTDPNNPVDPQAEGVEVRRFDCIDCHNRPSHRFLPPATSLNLALSQGTISSGLPYVRQVGLDLLDAEYATRAEANALISQGLGDYYRAQYPDRYDELAVAIDQAAATLLDIYNANFFPEMQTDYRVRTNNLSHFVNNGCFRCHFSNLQDEAGAPIASSCTSCHSIVAQGPSADVGQLDSDIAGQVFTHPVEIGDVWQRVRCTQCHTSTQGY